MVFVSGLFSIKSDTGVIRVGSSLAGKGRILPYELTVRATDTGTPSLLSEATLVIYIGDVSENDGIPSIIKPKPDQIIIIPEVS